MKRKMSVGRSSATAQGAPRQRSLYHLGIQRHKRNEFGWGQAIVPCENLLVANCTPENSFNFFNDLRQPNDEYVGNPTRGEQALPRYSSLKRLASSKQIQ